LQADAHRLLAEIAIHRGDRDTAAAHLEPACAIAGELGLGPGLADAQRLAAALG
jgi:hypothetical protein